MKVPRAVKNGKDPRQRFITFTHQMDREGGKDRPQEAMATAPRPGLHVSLPQAREASFIAAASSLFQPCLGYQGCSKWGNAALGIPLKPEDHFCLNNLLAVLKGGHSRVVFLKKGRGHVPATKRAVFCGTNSTDCAVLGGTWRE